MKKRWTQNDIEYLKTNYIEFGPDMCAMNLGRTKHSVKSMAARLGASGSRRKFTEEELRYIVSNYDQMGPIAIAKTLNLKRDSVYSAARRLGLKMTKSGRGAISTRTNTGRHVSDSTRKKIGNANRRHFEPNRCSECGRAIGLRAKRCQPCELRSRGGERHNWYNGGVTPLYGAVFKRLYPVWKFPVMARDNYECQNCGTTGTLEVHHLRLFTEIRDKVMNANPHLSPAEDTIELAELIVKEHRLEDGITLCRPCHEKFHWKKRGELLETPNASGEDNQQPSRSNLVLFVDRKVQRLTGEDTEANNPDTSAPHAIIASGVMI